MLFFILSVITLGIFSLIFFRLDANLLLSLYSKVCSNRNRLYGKTVWIVGASTGIGEELAYQLSDLDCKLILTSTTKSRLDAVKENCLKRSNNLKQEDILVLAYDITDLKQNEMALNQVIATFGDIDVVIPNAARATSSKTTEDMYLELHKKIFDVNYFANIHIGKLVVKHWLETKSTGLKIIAPTSSIGAYSDVAFFGIYNCSKKALNGFYRDLALQHSKDGISVVLTLPGPTKSELTANSIVQGGRKATVENENVMSTKRCCELIIVAIANKFSESWITRQPLLFMTYLASSYSFELFWITKLFNMTDFIEKRFFKDA